jgi:glutathione reductase (NADPH)
MELERLPEHVAFVGSGYIAFEFAHIAARAGARVTLLGRGARPLEGFDPDLVERLVLRSKEAGIEVRRGTEVTAVERQGQSLEVRMETPDGPSTLAADLVVHAAGRVPDIDDLDLEAAGVARGKKGITVNQYLQSVSNPDVYAAGDAAAAGGLPLTPTASLEGEVARKNILEGNRHEADYRGLPSVVFTVPALARVGLDEAAAKEQGLDVEVRQGDMASWYTARRVRETCAAYKVLIDRESGRILGAHLVGPGAEETINLFALAVRMGLRTDDLKGMLTAYPSAVSDVPSML